MKPYSAACDENKEPILSVLLHEFSHCQSVLEIGSGSGQHAIYFGQHLPQLTWQTSDVTTHHQGINSWLAEAAIENVARPIPLDVSKDPWPTIQYGGIFSANTVHIMAWDAVVKLFEGVSRVLEQNGRFCLYGPFSYGGKHTSQSNIHFDRWLKTQNPDSGVRDAETLHQLATSNQLQFVTDHEMPTNNRILVWRRC